MIIQYDSTATFANVLTGIAGLERSTLRSQQRYNTAAEICLVEIGSAFWPFRRGDQRE